MPNIPTAYAQKEAVPGGSVAPKMGEKLSIHSMDAPYEYAIQGAKQIGALGNKFGNEIGKMGNDVYKYIAKQKSIADKDQFMNAKDAYMEDRSAYLSGQLEALTDEHGVYVPASYAKDYQATGSTTRRNLQESLGLTEDQFGMFNKWANHFDSGQEIKNRETRVGLIRDKTASSLTTRVDKGVEDGDMSEVITAIKLRAELDPKWALTLEHDLNQANTTIRYNEQVDTIRTNPNNYKVPEGLFSPEMEEKLKIVRQQTIRQNEFNERVRRGDAMDELDNKIDDLTASEDYVKAMNDDDFTKKEKAGFKEDITAMRLKKSRHYVKLDFDTLQNDIDLYDPTTDPHKEKQQTIMTSISKFPAPQRKQARAWMAAQMKRYESVAKLTPVQTKLRTMLQDKVLHEFGWDKKSKGFIGGGYQVGNKTLYKGFFQGWFEDDFKPKEEYKIDQTKTWAAVANVLQGFDNWSAANQGWDGEEGAKKMEELNAPYAAALEQENIINTYTPKAAKRKYKQSNLEYTARRKNMSIEELKKQLGVE